MDKVYYTIGEFAKFFNISTKTLRHYDKKKLFKPDYIDECTKHRYYSKDQIKYFQIILILKDLGLSLDKIKRFEVQKNLLITKKMFENEIQNLTEIIIKSSIKKEKISHWLEFINFLQNDGKFEYLPELIIREDIKIAFIRKKTALEDFSRTKIFHDFTHITEKNCVETYGFYMGLYHEPFDKIDRNCVDFELCRRIDSNFDINNHDFTRILHGGTFASIIHKGCYSKLIDSYEILIKWISNNNYKITSPLIAIFILPEAMVDTPENAETKLIIKVDKKS